MDFPVTRSVIETIPKWVDTFVKLLPTPHKIPHRGRGFRWVHEKHDADTLQVAKAVRIASSLRAALILADIGHTVECFVLLRTVSDYAAEIIFIGEGVFQGRFTSEQQRFIDQQFSLFPLTSDELAACERDNFVGRKAIAKAFGRLAEKTGEQKDIMDIFRKILNMGYDSYVHGAYHTAMELFSGRNMSFLMQGTNSRRNICIAKVCVAAKVKEALSSFVIMSKARSLNKIEVELDKAWLRIDKSGEDSGFPCIRL